MAKCEEMDEVAFEQTFKDIDRLREDLLSEDVDRCSAAAASLKRMLAGAFGGPSFQCGALLKHGKCTLNRNQSHVKVRGDATS